MIERPGTQSSHITTLLMQWSAGDRSALDRVIPLVYAELRRIAARQLQRERGGEPLEPTDVVHALFMQLVDQRHATWENRVQFYAIAAQMMRRILVDHARARLAVKRGGLTVGIPIEELGSDALPSPQLAPVSDVLAVDQALHRLAERDPDQARIVELRFFAGLSVEDTAHALGWSASTVKREWRMAKAWLFRELSRTDCTPRRP